MWILQQPLGGFGGISASVLEGRKDFFHVYECLTKNWLQKQTVPEVFINKTQPLIATGLQYNASGVYGDFCSTCRPQHLFISNIQFTHLLFQLELFCLCQWQPHHLPSGPIRNVSDLLSYHYICTQICVHSSISQCYSESGHFIYSSIDLKVRMTAWL